MSTNTGPLSLSPSELAPGEEVIEGAQRAGILGALVSALDFTE